MAQWKKRTLYGNGIDFDMMEDLISELLEEFGEDEVDFSKPLKVGFSLSLDGSGCIHIDEFGLLKEKTSAEKKDASPLIEIIDFGSELLVVVEAANLPTKDIEVRASEQLMFVYNRNSKKFLKRVVFPCKVKGSTLRTNLNNGVLEVRIAKKDSEKSVANSK